MSLHLPKRFLTQANTDFLKGHSIVKKLGIKVLADAEGITELYHGIRTQITALLDGLDPKDLATMSLGLSHSLSRYTLSLLREFADD